MKRDLMILSLTLLSGSAVYGQSAIDAYRLSQPDLKGTARFMSMGGAFGALGGDLSTLSQNPAGIGVYRTGDVGFTVDLDCQGANAKSNGSTTDMSQIKFLLNNIGAVFTMRLPSATVPNLNIGFTYNKGTSFNRRYAGYVPNLKNSLSNYIAGICNDNNLTVGDVTTGSGFDPYNPNDGGYAAPWISILGYDSYLVDPSDDTQNAEWYGQWGEGTSGAGSFDVEEKGSVDEYNIAVGGNISNVVYWGMNFDIVNINYTMNSLWGESLDNAYVPDDNGEVNRQDADWDLMNYYHVNGTGFKYSLGVILKPIQELRIGLAFHTPTWYSLQETYDGGIRYNYGGNRYGQANTNQGYPAYNNMDFRTPWKISASVAGVIGGRFILSADYEYQAYNKMKFSEPGTYGLNNGWDYDDDYYPWYSPVMPGTRAIGSYGYYDDTNSDIEYYYQGTNTLRLGAEYRVTPAFSVRAGYSYVTSPVKTSVRDDREIVYTAGTMPNYRLDNDTNYITCGLGYRYQRFYVDLAYVYKNMKSTYHAYTPDVENGHIYSPSPQSSVSFNNNQIILTAGFRF